MTRPVRLLAAVVCLCVLLASCVGPARTTSTYRDKAVLTAQDALSQVQTVRLAVQTDQRGSMLHSYLEVMLEDAAEAIGSIQNTFDSIQPPNTDEADAIREDLDDLLADGVDGVAQLRIAARRGDSGTMRSVADDLADVADELRAFAEKPGR